MAVAFVYSSPSAADTRRSICKIVGQAIAIGRRAAASASRSRVAFKVSDDARVRMLGKP